MSLDRVKDVGKRSYSASTYYNISADRPNLTVFVGTQVCYSFQPPLSNLLTVS